ncbi:cytochrome b-c1 complex subunit 2, mitochondrial [Malaya genurostris]|uniref:cytochrome b-c1 complex subunit 2, mitochondrial n=1 Tax=Malaya genurostris TaxID=325434 RepID=UPI0026F3C47F|nr:cytochrome b-c1 complex subunit 2, mitochondrial [Malaya genurostris]XP_058460158.1 cytochrome b-c1 complex subunit 2, mitochondrial [Malaya genurostris]XP_058460159.1 cytochrome b-c1 complex subunit 2, mitochondrial [Malaya genurostris]
MASVVSKTPLLRAAAARGYAAQAQAAAASRGSNEAQTTTLPNKLVVASAEPNAAVARVSIVYRAGSRNESAENLGASHVLRATAGLSTKTATGFGITRNLQQVGGSLTTTGDRELITYTVAVTKDHLETGLKYLEAAATGHVFKPWELADITPLIKADIARIPVQVQAVEALHKAAFHTGLGNSVFCPKYQAGKHSSETMLHYVAANCTANRAAVSALGVDHQLLVGFAQSLGLESAASAEGKSEFNSSEIRHERGGNRAAVAVATQAVGWSNLKECLAYIVLQYAAGAGPVTKRGGNNGALTKLIGNDVATSALCSSYTDNGLFGFVVAGNTKDVGKAVEAGVKGLKSLNVSDADVARGKAGVLAWVLSYLEDQSTLSFDLGEQAALLGQVYGKSELAAAINGVSTGDVQAVARKVASGKLAVGAVGNLSRVPYLSNLN